MTDTLKPCTMKVVREIMSTMWVETIHCSECRGTFLWIDTGLVDKETLQYCPKCGAKTTAVWPLERE